MAFDSRAWAVDKIIAKVIDGRMRIGQFTYANPTKELPMYKILTPLPKATFDFVYSLQAFGGEELDVFVWGQGTHSGRAFVFEVADVKAEINTMPVDLGGVFLADKYGQPIPLKDVLIEAAIAEAERLDKEEYEWEKHNA